MAKFVKEEIVRRQGWGDTFDSIPYMPRIPFPVVQKFESAQWEPPSHYLSVLEGNDGFSYDYTIVSGCNIPSCKTFLTDLEGLRKLYVVSYQGPSGYWEQDEG